MSSSSSIGINKEKASANQNAVKINEKSNEKSNANSHIDKKLNNKNNNNHVFGSGAHQNPRITSNLNNGQTLSHRNDSSNRGSFKTHTHKIDRIIGVVIRIRVKIQSELQT